MKRSPVSADDMALMALPTIASQMPVRFKNGATWDQLSGECKSCGKDINHRCFTGRIARLVESVATVEAVGVCPPCQLVTRFHYRLHDDMRISGLTDKGWAQWKARPTLSARLLGWLSRIMAS